MRVSFVFAALLVCLAPGVTRGQDPSASGGSGSVPGVPAGFSRCPTGQGISQAKIRAARKTTFATLIRRYGANSDQVKAFVPAGELRAAARAAARMAPVPGEDNAVPPGLAALTASELVASDVDPLSLESEAPGADGLDAVGGVARAAKKPKGVVLQTWFHVIKNSTGAGAVKQQRILDQIDVLNAAYKKSGFSFQLAGTTETVNDAWFTADWSGGPQDTMKSTLRKGSASTLNIYLNNIGGGLLGYATLPEFEAQTSDDGVVIHFETIPGGRYTPYDLGDTATHEVGHWLGLLHTFQGGCSSSSAGGDGVKDTPAEKEPAFGCPVNRNSCPNLSGKDPIFNFMDYSDDSCMRTFTKGQITRMKAQWAAYRNNK